MFEGSYASSQLHSVVRRLNVAFFEDHLIVAVQILWKFSNAGDTTGASRILQGGTVNIDFECVGIVKHTNERGAHPE